MNLPDPRILKFIKEHHVLTIATCAENKPWCANCYYVYLENEVGFVITSEFESRHIQEALANTNVSGSIVLESEIISKIQGIQFEGKLKILDSLLSQKAKASYLKRYPMASITHNSLWFLEVNFIKYTDNRIIPDNKLLWKR